MLRRASLFAFALVAALAFTAMSCADTTAPRAECTATGYHGSGTNPC